MHSRMCATMSGWQSAVNIASCENTAVKRQAFAEHDTMQTLTY